MQTLNISLVCVEIYCMCIATSATNSMYRSVKITEKNARQIT